jgi:hypothetical protein
MVSWVINYFLYIFRHAKIMPQIKNYENTFNNLFGVIYEGSFSLLNFIIIRMKKEEGAFLSVM